MFPAEGLPDKAARAARLEDELLATERAEEVCVERALQRTPHRDRPLRRAIDRLS
jgi:hypothetical protein